MQLLQLLHTSSFHVMHFFVLHMSLCVWAIVLWWLWWLWLLLLHCRRWLHQRWLWMYVDVMRNSLWLLSCLYDLHCVVITSNSSSSRRIRSVVADITIYTNTICMICLWGRKTVLLMRMRMTIGGIGIPIHNKTLAVTLMWEVWDGLTVGVAVFIEAEHVTRQGHGHRQVRSLIHLIDRFMTIR